jgi:pyruvate/2-oxoglutarate dehydrogenase complex dihydrolipoamide acyltransferase (E2) component
VAYEFKLPDLGEGLTEGEIGRWLVQEGQEVAEDDPLVEIQTDKTTVEIPSPAAGKVARILVAEGKVVPVGTVLVVIGDDESPATPATRQDGGQAADRPKACPQPVPDRSRDESRIRATPLVRRLAQELGVDLGAVVATGPGGRVTEADVRAAGQAPGASEEGRREPIRGVRRKIVEHMTQAHREIPAVTYVEECDFTGFDLHLLVPAVLSATAQTLKDFPELNARLEGDEIVYLERHDLGFAVQTEQGLVVPVVRSCDTASLDDLDAEVRRLADAARAGTLKPEELRGSTFTITSAGKLAGLLATPLINHPEVAILGVHRIGPRAAVRDGQVVVRQIGNLSITFDHRVVEGARAAEFVLALIDRLQRASDPLD